MTNHHVGADALQKMSTPRRTTSRDGFYAKTQRRRIEVPRSGTERPDEHRGRDRPRSTPPCKPDMSPAEAAAARRKVMAEIEKESFDKTGLAQRTSSRSTRAASITCTLQEVHRRPPGLRAGAADRLLRRRPGQLRVPALRPRRLLLPRLRERQAGQDRALPEVEQGRRERRRTGLRLRPPRPDQPAQHRRRTRVPPRRPVTRTCCSGSTAWKCC